MQSVSHADAAQYRRLDSLVCYWDEEGYVLHEPLTGARARVPEFCCQLLAAFGEWRTVESVVEPFPESQRSFVSGLVERLCDLGFLHRANGKQTPDARNAWNTWGHATGFFHFSTRDVPWMDRRDAQDFENVLAAKPAPAAGTTSRRLTRATVSLTRADVSGPFADVLRSRRTWRDFGEAPVPVASLSALLELTFGDQLVAVTQLGRRVVLKTSPSPGATQSLAAYVVASNVSDLKNGLYWYNSAKHRLERLRGSASPRTLGAWLGGQWWFERAGVLVFLTGSLARIQHRYPYARAYRSWLLEAGHVCQTFCLTATWLNLAPFCTQALADSRIERALGLNPLHETVLYAMGAGTRPPGRLRGPWPSDHDPDEPYLRPGRGSRRRRT